MEYDLIIIGAGPAGYVAAIRAGQLGMKTALLEKKEVGGMCLNWGCIPTKALIESAKFYNRIKTAENLGIDGIDQSKVVFNWTNAKKRSAKIVTKLTGGVNYLLKKNGVEVIKGEARLTSPNTVSIQNRSLEAKNIFLGTGSYPAPLEIDLPEGKLVQVEYLLDMEELPKRIVLVGHGPVTLELAQFFQLIDKEITVISPVENILPGIDDYLRQYILKKTHSQGIRIIENSKIGSADDNLLKVNDIEIPYDVVINCSWRNGIAPPTDIDLSRDSHGFIPVDEFLETKIPGIFAIGDVNGLSYLAHAASAQGIFAVNHVQGVQGNMDMKQCPINIYTHPEVAQIGLTEREIRDKGIEYRIGEFPMSANGKALAEDSADGMIRILSGKKLGEVLGVQIIAANATDLIAEAAAFMSVEATVYDVARTMHAHPTVSEVFLEAGMDAADKPIHK
ncbi:MAG: dihydrolipoyl dehydrogenase [Bacteroidales bacterium]|jgi:dihydrolipoamide dehydrogenase